MYYTIDLGTQKNYYTFLFIKPRVIRLEDKPVVRLLAVAASSALEELADAAEVPLEHAAALVTPLAGIAA